MATAGQMAAAAAVAAQRMPGMPVNMAGMIPGSVPGMPPNVFQPNPFMQQLGQPGLSQMAMQMGLGMNMPNMGIPGMIPGVTSGFIPGMPFAPGFQQTQVPQQAVRPLFPSAAVSAAVATQVCNPFSLTDKIICSVVYI